MGSGFQLKYLETCEQAVGITKKKNYKTQRHKARTVSGNQTSHSSQDKATRGVTSSTSNSSSKASLLFLKHSH